MELSDKHINDLVHARVAITTEVAASLARVLGSTASFWLTREANYRIALEREVEQQRLTCSIPWLAQLPVTWMIKHGWVAKCATKADQVDELLRFFGVRSVAAWDTRYGNIAAAWRSSSSSRLVPGAVAAFIRKAEMTAEKMETRAYDRAAFKDELLRLRQLTKEDDVKLWVPALRVRCAAAGVAVVFVPHPPGCPISGATKWLAPGKAMLVLSLRHKTNDHLWFSFFHEAGHVLLHSKKMEFIEGIGGLDRTLEDEADVFARDLLIPPGDFAVVRGAKTEVAVRTAAARLGIAPGILVGRLQKEGALPWTHLNGLKVR